MKKTILNNDHTVTDDFFTVEAYKEARTNIVLSILKKGCKKIVVTSSLAKEGKTTTCCNIAAALSLQVNCKVLLIDCDLRKPAVSKFFRLQNSPGITHFLSGMCELEDMIQKVPNTKLSVICSGIIPPNPSELLACQALDDMLDKLEERYDYIMIDVPPVNLVIDALPLIKKADGTIIVVYEGKSNFQELDRTVNTLRRFDANIIGFVMNGSTKRDSESYRYHKEYKYFSET